MENNVLQQAIRNRSFRSEEGMIVTDFNGVIEIINEEAMKKLDLDDILDENTFITSLFPDMLQKLGITEIHQLSKRIKSSGKKVVFTDAVRSTPNDNSMFRITLDVLEDSYILYNLEDSVEQHAPGVDMDLHLYKEIVDSLSDIIYKSDYRGDIQYVNPAVIKVLGYSVEEAEQMHYLDFIREDWKQELEAFYIDQLKSKTVNTYMEFPVLTKGGEERWIGQTVRLIKDGDWVTGFYGVARDITKLKSAESDLHQSEKRFRYLLDNAEDAIYITEPQTWKILRGNRSLQSLLGYSEGELLDATVFDIRDEEDEDIIRNKYDVLLREGHFIFEARLKDKLGNLRDVEVNSKLLKYGDKEVILSIARDISARKKREQLNINSVLEGQENERERLAKDLHDSIYPMLSVVLRKIENITGKSNASDFIELEGKEAMEMLASTINELRAVSYNLASPSLRDLGLVAALRDMCSNSNNTAKPVVQFYTSSELLDLSPKTEVNLFRIAQELLNNAIKHANAEIINVQLIKHEKTVILMVEDDGVGIDVNAVKGIGLVSLQGRVMALGGDLTIDTKPNKGATIIIEVPMNNS